MATRRGSAHMRRLLRLRRVADANAEGRRVHRAARRGREGGQAIFLYVPLRLTAHADPAHARSGRARAAESVCPFRDANGLEHRADRRVEIENTGSPRRRSSSSPATTAARRGKIRKLRAKGHEPSHIFRGNKRGHLRRGGHRVSVHRAWPAKVKAGTTSDQTICLTDCLRHDRANHRREAAGQRG